MNLVDQSLRSVVKIQVTTDQDTVYPLTVLELHVLDQLGQVAYNLHKIINEGNDAGCRANDWNEVAIHIHNLQHMVMAQAAARCYPDLMRKMGSTIDG